MFCFFLFIFFDNFREENDIALAQKLQEQMKIQSNSTDQTTYNIHSQSSDDHVRLNIIFLNNNYRSFSCL